MAELSPQYDVDKGQRNFAGSIAEVNGGAEGIFDDDIFATASGSIVTYQIPSAASLGLSSSVPSYKVAARYSVPLANLSAVASAVALRLKHAVPTRTASLAGVAPVLRFITRYPVPAAPETLASYAPSWKTMMKFSIPVATLSVAGHAGTMRTRFAVPSKALNLSSSSPVYRSVLRFVVPAASLGLGGQTPTLRMLVTTRYQIPTGTLTLVSQAGALRLRYGAPLRSASLAGQVPVFRQMQKWAIPYAAALLLSTVAPTFKQIFRVPTATLQNTGQTPSWRTSQLFKVPQASLTLTGHTPRFKQTFSIPVSYVALAHKLPSWREVLTYSIPSGLNLGLVGQAPLFKIYDPTLRPYLSKISWALERRDQDFEDQGYYPVTAVTERSFAFEDMTPDVSWTLNDRTFQGEI